MAKSAAELQMEVRRLLEWAERLVVRGGSQVPAECWLTPLQDMAARLAGYMPSAVPPSALEMEVQLQRLRVRLRQEQDYQAWVARRPARRMLLYQFAWLSLVAALTALWWHLKLTGGLQPVREVEVLLGCMAWGTVGASFSSILALVRRKAERTLLPDYETWHLVKGLVGAFVGAMVFLLLAAGVRFFITEELLDAQGWVGVLRAVAERAYVAYLLSTLMGFQERAFFTKIEQLIKTLLGLEPAPAPTPPVVCQPCCCQTHRLPDPPPQTPAPAGQPASADTGGNA